MEDLFGNPDIDPAAQAESAPSPWPAGQGGAGCVSVAVNANLWRSFDYLWPLELGTPIVGQRVHVPFGRGNRKTLAFVMAVGGVAGGGHEMKYVQETVDTESPFSPPLWRLAEWISRYYLTPQGMVLAAMIPSAIGKHGPRVETVAFLSSHHADWPSNLGLRQRKVLDELFEARKQGVEPLTIEDLMHHSGGDRVTIRRLVERELIRTETRPVRLPELSDQTGGDPFELNEDQQAALTSLAAKLPQQKQDAGETPTTLAKFSVTLLHGVTGSGKTEVYVRAIRQVIAAGRQAILLAPEIALATQTLQRLLQRLPRVAVLHSGLGSAQRAFYWDQIRQGHASVIVGPRSAIFAPAPWLGLIIVDEEHEPSYKQDTAPRYHGRDAAIMRASLEGVPVILGSATPSLESFHNAQQGRYDLLALPRRVKSLPMPRLSVVNLRQEMAGGRVMELIGPTLTHRMAATLDRHEQVILLMNRRGYASYVFCPSCQWIMQCDHCSRAMVFHQATQLAMCHYCQKTAQLPEFCPACRKKLLLFGFGIQRIEGELARKFPAARMARMDSDTMTSPAQFQKVLGAFSAGEVDILLGTQMVAKGLDFPKVTLVGVVSADTSLVLPDFRSAERTFQLIVQVAGRAGRADRPGEVVVQTLHEEEPAIRLAVGHDYRGFVAGELPLRQSAGMPPYMRLIRFVARHSDSDKARESAGRLAESLRGILAGIPVRIVGPQPASVLKIQDLFRFEVHVYCARAGAVQQRLVGRMESLCRDLPAEIVTDVDPMSLM